MLSSLLKHHSFSVGLMCFVSGQTIADKIVAVTINT